MPDRWRSNGPGYKGAGFIPTAPLLMEVADLEEVSLSYLKNLESRRKPSRVFKHLFGAAVNAAEVL